MNARIIPFPNSGNRRAPPDAFAALFSASARAIAREVPGGLEALDALKRAANVLSPAGAGAA